MKKNNLIKQILLFAICFIFLLIPTSVFAERLACGEKIEQFSFTNAVRYTLYGKDAWCVTPRDRVQTNAQYEMELFEDSSFAKFAYAAFEKYGFGGFSSWGENKWKVYLAIRQYARNHNCGNDSTCKDIEEYQKTTGNKKCTLYKATSFANNHGACDPADWNQEMYVPECSPISEQTPCPSSQHCCKDGEDHYVDGVKVDENTYKDKCEPTEEACRNQMGCCKTENPEKYFFDKQEVTPDEYRSKCEPTEEACRNQMGCCKTENPEKYFYDKQEVTPEVYRDNCENECKNTSGCCKSNGNFYYDGVKVEEAVYNTKCPCDRDGCCKTNEPKYYIDRIQKTEAEYSKSCCEEFYDLCCVLNGKYYLEGVQVTDKKKCLSCKPAVSYHDSCQLKYLNPMDEIDGYDGGESVGEVLKTKFENEESINFITYKEVDDDNIIKCVLTKQTDYAENPLRDSRLVKGNNRYCKVFCKDDVGKFYDDGKLREEPFPFGYSVSGMQEANSGRYFRLNAEFTSKRTCFSTSNDDNSDTKEINLDKFNREVKEVVDRLQDKVNEMNRTYAEWEFMDRVDPTPGFYEPGNDYPCNPDSYRVNTLHYYDTSSLKIPPKYKISFDFASSTTHHFSFKVEVVGNESPSPDIDWEDELDWYPDSWTYKYTCDDDGDGYEDDQCEEEIPVACYFSMDNVKDLYDAAVDAKKTHYQNLYREIKADLDLIKSYVDDINECTKWFDEKFTNELFNPDPIVNYKYGYDDEDGNNDQAYYNALGTTEMDKTALEPVSQDKEWTDKTTIYNESGNPVPVIPVSPQKYPCVDDQYSKERDGIECVKAAKGNYETVVYVGNESFDLNDKDYYYEVPTHEETFDNYVYTRKSIERTYKYTSPNEFATLYPSGAVVLRNDGIFSSEEYVTFDGLPVQIETTNGTHKFTFTFSNIGEYFDGNNETGRIFDSKEYTSEKTVLGKYNEKEEQKIFTGLTDDKDYNYVCYYRVNQSTCPTCTPTCNDEDCTSIPDCVGPGCTPCPYCNPECVDCIYSVKEYQLDFTPIPVQTTSIYSGTSSPGPGGFSIVTVVNPNADENNGASYVPYNWNWNTWTTYDDYGQKYSILNEKAKLTIDEIQTYGELIYVSKDLGTNNVFEEDPRIDEIGSTLEDFGVLKVVMTPSLAQEIRDYNKRENSFSNSTLTCYDYVYKNTYKFEKVFCYSSFLDQYTDNPNFKFSDKRFQNSNLRSGRDDQGDYWTTFISQVDLSDQSSATQYAGSIVKIKNGDMEKIGGPAWK